MGKERLDKLLASQGIGSRSDVKKLIWTRQVMVNGEVVTAPDYKADGVVDAIVVNGTPLAFRKHLYLMLHKPQGVVSATKDGNLPTVLDLVPPQYRRKNLFPAGRLDKDTEGFVLITDDGVFAHRMLSPKSHVEKEYEATIDGAFNPAMITAFSGGVALADGEVCMPAVLNLLKDGEHARVRVILQEGMYHQIKRMFGVFGYRVLYLRRVRIGAVWLDPNLPLGSCRELSVEEVLAIENTNAKKPNR